MKPFLTIILASLLGFAASAQVDMSVPQVTNSPKWFATGITQSWQAIPRVAGFDVTTNSYRFTLIDQTNLHGVHQALNSYAGKQEVYRGLTNGGWEGPDYSPPTGTRYHFCCGTYEFLCLTNPSEPYRMFQCGRATVNCGMPIHECLDGSLTNWLFLTCAPTTNSSFLSCKTEVVKLAWPVN